MKKYIVILSFLFLAASCGKARTPSSKAVISTNPSVHITTNSSTGSSDSSPTPQTNSTAIGSTSIEPGVYKYGSKALKLINNNGNSYALVLSNGNERKTIFTSCPTGSMGCDDPILGTTTVPYLAHINISSENGIWDSLFINLDSEKTLEYYVINQFKYADIKENNNVISVTPDPVSGIKTIGFKFAFTGSCEKDGKIQYGKKMVKVTGISINTEYSNKDIQPAKLTYSFDKPKQLTCIKSADSVGFYQEDMRMTMYGIHKNLDEFGISINGTDSSGASWQNIFGFDIKNQNIIPWQNLDKGFGYSPPYAGQ